jgi:hypothetical protein
MEKRNRILSALHYSFSLLIGVLVGPPFCAFVGSVIIEQLRFDPILGKVIFINEHLQGWIWLFFVLGFFIYTPQFLEAWERYVHIRNLKYQHQITFIEVRKYNRIFGSPVTDFIWAYGYTVIEILVLTASTVITGSVAFHIFMPVMSVLAILPAVLFGWLASFPANRIILLLFWPNRLERELKNAPGIIRVIKLGEEEARRQLEGKEGYR